MIKVQQGTVAEFIRFNLPGQKRSSTHLFLLADAHKYKTAANLDSSSGVESWTFIPIIKRTVHGGTINKFETHWLEMSWLLHYDRRFAARARVFPTANKCNTVIVWE